MEIAQKYHNANMAGNTIDPDTIDADAWRVFNLARQIRRDNDDANPDGQALNNALDARHYLIQEIADAAVAYVTDEYPDAAKVDIDYSAIGAEHSKEIDDYCVQVASVGL